MRRMYSKKQIEEIAKSASQGGTKLYKHEISGILSSNANARLIIYSTSSDLLNDRFKLTYDTESFLRVSYVGDIISC